MLASDTVI